MSKYLNKKVVIDNITFASLREGRRYEDLKLLLQAGEIRDLRWQVPFVFVVNGVRIGRYTADFAYYEERPAGAWLQVVEDVKSSASKTEAYGLRKRLMLACFGVAIRET